LIDTHLAHEIQPSLKSVKQKSYQKQSEELIRNDNNNAAPCGVSENGTKKLNG